MERRRNILRRLTRIGHGTAQHSAAQHTHTIHIHAPPTQCLGSRHAATKFLVFNCWTKYGLLISGCIKLIRVATGRVCRQTKYIESGAVNTAHKKNPVCALMREDKITEISATCSALSIDTRRSENRIRGLVARTHDVLEYYALLIPLTLALAAIQCAVRSMHALKRCTFRRSKAINIFSQITSKSIAIYAKCINFVLFAVICSYVITSIRIQSLASVGVRRAPVLRKLDFTIPFVPLHFHLICLDGDLASHQICYSRASARSRQTTIAWILGMPKTVYSTICKDIPRAYLFLVNLIYRSPY